MCVAGSRYSGPSASCPYSPKCLEVEFSEVPIAPAQHEGGLIYRAWAMAFRSYRASSTSFSVLRSFPSWRSAARF